MLSKIIKNCKKHYPISFHEFKKLHVETINDYKKKPIIQEICKNDEYEISKAYESYCRLKYNRYISYYNGGNFGRMI